MATEERSDVQDARTVGAQSIPVLLASKSEEVLDALIDNPSLDETHICILLERKDLAGRLLEEVSKRKAWRGSYRVRLALARHPHTPRLVATKLLRDLHLMDLVKITMLPTSSGELRLMAEERIIAQLPQLPLGQRLTLARRGSSRIASGLIVEGPEQVVRIALDNHFLTESHLLKTLAKDALPARSVAAIAKHGKWSKQVNIRVALLRHPHLPVEHCAALVSDLPRRELQDLVAHARLEDSVRVQVREELSRREKVL